MSGKEVLGMLGSVMVAIVIMVVGTYAFFVTMSGIDSSTESSKISLATANISSTVNSVFDVVGVVLIFGALMTVVGLLYSFLDRPKKERKQRRKQTEVKKHVGPKTWGE